MPLFNWPFVFVLIFCLLKRYRNLAINSHLYLTLTDCEIKLFVSIDWHISTRFDLYVMIFAYVSVSARARDRLHLLENYKFRTISSNAIIFSSTRKRPPSPSPHIFLTFSYTFFFLFKCSIFCCRC